MTLIIKIVIQAEWKVDAFIINDFDQIFAFYQSFSLTSYSTMFATLLIFGIFVLPFIINEIAFFDNQHDEHNYEIEDQGQTVKEAEESLDRFMVFLKRRFGPIKKIENYTLTIGIMLTIIGSYLMGLPYFFLVDSEHLWDRESEQWYREGYYGFIRGQLFLTGILLLVIGILLMLHFIRKHR